MTPDFPTDPRQALETSLTALLLGELPADQEAFLRQAIAQDAELKRVYERLEQTIGLVRETASEPTAQQSAQPAPLKLSEARRQELLRRFKTISPKEFAAPRRRATLVGLGIAAVVIGLVGILAIPALHSAKTKSMSFSMNHPRLGALTAPQGSEERLGRLSSQVDRRFSEKGKNAEDMPSLTPSVQAEAQHQPPLRGRTTIVLPASEQLAEVRGLSEGRDQFGEAEATQERLRALGPQSVASYAAVAGGGGLGGAGGGNRYPNGPLMGGGGAPANPTPVATPPALTPPVSLGLTAEPEAAAAFSRRYGLAPDRSAAGRFMTQGIERKPANEPAQTAAATDPATGLAIGDVPLVDPTTGLPATSPDSAKGISAVDPATGLPVGSVAPVDATTGLPFVPQPCQPAIVVPSTPLSASYEQSFRYGSPKGSRASVGTSSGTVVYRGISVMTNGHVEMQRLLTDKEQQKNGDVLLADSAAQHLINPRLGGQTGSNNRVDKELSLGETPAVGRLFQPGTEGAAAVIPMETAVTESVKREANQILLRQKLADADDAKAAGDEEKARRLFSDSLAHADSIGSDRVPSEAAQARAGLGGIDYANVITNQLTGSFAVPLKPLSVAIEQTNAAAVAPGQFALAKDTGGRQALGIAKSNLDELQHLSQLLYLKMGSEGAELAQPKNGRVEIVDRAVPVAAGASVGQRLRSAITGESKSVARVKVERDASDLTTMSSPKASAGGTYDPYFIQTEFEALQSEAVLGKVVEKLKLNEAWAKDHGAGEKLQEVQAVELLKKKLNLRSVPNTSVIEIRVKSSKPEEAAQLANAIAETYQEYRLEQRKQSSESGIKALQEQQASLEAQIEQAQAIVDRERAKLQPGLSNSVEAQTSQTASNPVTSDSSPPKPASPPPEPQPEVQTGESAFSTFSLNVSDVSFKLAAASLEKGVLPEPASIRSEEFINAFDYRDPEPAAGAPIAFAWERARYPFAQGRDLLRFSLKTAAEGRQAGKPLNLVLLLDNSGSMERADRISIIKEALRVLATQLQAQDTFSVVTFARTPRLWVDGVPGNQAGQVAEEAGNLTPQGGTNLGDALDLAYQTALRHYQANGLNRLVLLTDGAANLGDVEPDELKKKVETNRKQGIALDCFGIGWEGYNDDLLEVLTRNGDGRYGFINTPDEAATEFAGQLAGALHVAASDVKVQVEFNPRRVTAYRQIGYAKHQLTKEQFRDNSVDAAELGAAESGNALYVVDVNGGGDGPLAVVRVRYKVPGTAEYHEQEWAVPYSGSAALLEQSSPAMRLAATASAFSEWLATSPYAAEVTPDRLLSYLSGVPEVYGADARPKKLEWMVRQAKSLAGK